MSASGGLDVADLRTVDDDLKQDFIKWQRLHIAGFRYVSSPASLRIDHITVVAPYARVIIGADHTVNVSEALHPRGVAQDRARRDRAGDRGRREAPGALRADRWRWPSVWCAIANGTADYADFSMQPNFATGIQDLHGTIKGLSSDPSSRATVDLQGRVDRYAPVDISGVVNLFAATTYADIKMTFRGLELTRMTPYAVRFAGYKIASGTLDADLHYKLDHGRLDADHQFVIDQLELGDQVASPHATKLPLRLAVALLKDRDGVIRIGLPVTGSLNDPQFSLGPLIGKALIHLLEKAVTAPFAMLGRMFGGGADVNRIDFPPGSATLLPAAQARVAAVAKALAQRPQLQLQVPAVFSPDIDKPALAQRQLRHELIALARSGAGVAPWPGHGRQAGNRLRRHGRAGSAGASRGALPAAARRLPERLRPQGAAARGGAKGAALRACHPRDAIGLAQAHAGLRRRSAGSRAAARTGHPRGDSRGRGRRRRAGRDRRRRGSAAQGRQGDGRARSKIAVTAAVRHAAGLQGLRSGLRGRGTGDAST